jgi:hypothetical protein
VATGLGFPATRGRYVYAVNPHPIASDHLSFNLVSGVWSDTVRWEGSRSQFLVVWLWQQSVISWHTAVLMAAVGAVLLAGYGLTRRRVPGLPLPGSFPALAVSVFGATGLALLVFGTRARAGIYDPRPLVAVCLAVALGYAVRLGQARLRQR